MRPETSASRPGTASGRPGTARAAGLFKDPFLNSNPILLEYLTQAEIEKHEAPAAGSALRAGSSLGGSVDGEGGVRPASGSGSIRGGSRGGSSAGGSRPGEMLEALPEGSSLTLPDGSAAGVVSLRRPLVERLRLTAAAMEGTAHANVDALVASALFDGGGVDEDPASSELRQLLVALQDLTAERDEAVAALRKAAEETAEAAEAGGELSALREENAALRKENANMFTLMEENAGLRTEVETLRLRLACAEAPNGEA